jgi:hypothetical protein
MNVGERKAALVGTWASLAPEIRPSKNPDGTNKPFFLERRFVYRPDDRFGLTVTKVGERQSILAKAFHPFGLQKGAIFQEYDLVHLAHSMLFWGARNVDGRGFVTEANRPTNLQIPWVRAES